MFIFFLFFFFSGFCGLVYQVVWLRMAMADFGVTSALVAIVLSVFMAGLSLGSWAGGAAVRRYKNRPAGFFFRLYGATELAIGVSGLAVVPLLGLGRTLLAGNAVHASWGSSGYYLATTGWIVLVMLPFCTCMGVTFPVAMAAIRSAFPDESPKSFSYLYLANVLGATVGTLGSAFVFIELIGFSKTLLLAAAVNAAIAVTAAIFARRRFVAGSAPGEQPARQDGIPHTRPASAIILPLLLTTGLSSLGMEVVWTRQFVRFLGPVVYSFATMLAVYLAATALGSRIYRIWIRRHSATPDSVWKSAAVLAAFFSLVPLAIADPRLDWMTPGWTKGTGLWGMLRVGVALGPFCAVLGFLTSMLVDRWSSGNPRRAGTAYALNGIGCILGPLLSGFVLMPAVGERWTLVLLSLPLFAFGFIPLRGTSQTTASEPQKVRFAVLVTLAAVSLLLIVQTRDFADSFPRSQVRRDHTATVIAYGQGMDKHLLVNGIGMTGLAPITKMMVHLPMAHLAAPPKRALVLCFGMGTSFRSALSWGIPVTVVELVPSVPPLFGFFHADGPELLRSPRATVVLDDARRFLERTHEKYDIIVIDPPPPVEAAGSSLLYSREFYQVAARHLRTGGILQQWLPYGEPVVTSAMAKAIDRSFADTRVFRSMEGWGLHFLASALPIPRRTAEELAAHVPDAPSRDLLEWGPASTVQEQFQKVLDGETEIRALIQSSPHAPMLTDDRPVNEYYILRRRGQPFDDRLADPTSASVR